MANLQTESPSHGLRYYLTAYWSENGDPRTVGLPLIQEGPWACYTVIAIYLLFVTRWGPSMMAKREPYQMRLPMLVYNVTMVVFNFYFLIRSLVSMIWFWFFNFQLFSYYFSNFEHIIEMA